MMFRKRNVDVAFARIVKELAERGDARSQTLGISGSEIREWIVRWNLVRHVQ